MLEGKQFGRYKVRERLGAGGMGEVYLAHDEQLDRAVALKILSAEFLLDQDRQQRFRQEARAASALNHPNIITIYEVGENDSGSFLATEFISGKTLREYIRDKSLSLVQILKIVEQAANALVAAHAAHIVHRDIKPENIMVRDDSIVKVLDFGLAKPMPPSASDCGEPDELVKTIPGMVMGSVRYMSPEQARGLAVDSRTDIWSLGVILYELLTGRPPFDGSSAGDTIAAVLCKEPSPLFNFLPNATPELQRIVRKALQKDRDERYQSSKDLAIDLKNLIYEIEHLNSGERIHLTSERINISENPTMMHYSTSAGHLYTQTSSQPQATGTVNRKSSNKLFRLVLISLAVVLLAGVGFGIYYWSKPSQNLIATAFNNYQSSAIVTDGKSSNTAISPDGKYLAYVSGETGSRSLVVRQLSTDSAVTLIQPTALNMIGITFSPDGDYIYYLQTREDSVVNTLYRIPTLGGTPKKLIEDVDSGVSFSPDGKQMTFHRNSSQKSIVIIFTANIDGSNMQPLIRTDETEFNTFSNPKWSPDGKTILVQAFNNSGGNVLKTFIGEISVSEKKLKTLGQKDWLFAGDFNWLPDNSGFLFIGRDVEGTPLQIWRYSYPDGGARPVTNDTNSYFSLQLSKDGKSIIALKNNASSSIWNYNPANKTLRQLTAESQNQEGSFALTQIANGEIYYWRRNGKEESVWAMSNEGGNAQQIIQETKGIRSNLAVTPDNRFVVFSSPNSGTLRIWRTDIDGKNPLQLTKEDPDYGDFTPQITADGKTVIYQAYSGGNSGHAVLKKVSIDGGDSTIFYEKENQSFSNTVISPDGKMIAFETFTKDPYGKTITIALLENNSLGRIVKELSADLVNQFKWTPNGKSLTINSNRSGTSNLWELPIDGSASSQITDFKSGRINNFTWSADGKTLLVVRGNVNIDMVLLKDK